MVFLDRQPRDGPSSNTGGFQGSIDTWNPNPAGEQTTSTGDRGSDHRGGRSGRGSRGGRGGGSSGKDAFDNAGNWGDDFPQADDWDNEEYTGSLKDTKIFTSSQAGGGGPKQKTPPNQQPQQQVRYFLKCIWTLTDFENRKWVENKFKISSKL